jgi:ketosteroid isomerase-like protein
VGPTLERRIRDSYAAFVAGDLDGAVAGIAEDVTLINPPDAVETGTLHGREALRAALQRLHDDFEYDSLEVLEMAQGPHGVVVVSRLEGRGRGSGAPMKVTLTHVFELSGGRVAAYRWFYSRAEGRAAAGL